MTNKNTDELTLEQRLLDRAQQNGLEPSVIQERVQQKIVEIAQNSEPYHIGQNIVAFAGVMGLQISEDIAPQLYAELDRDKDSRSVSSQSNGFEKILRDTGIWPPTWGSEKIKEYAFRGSIVEKAPKEIVEAAIDAESIRELQNEYRVNNDDKKERNAYLKENFPEKFDSAVHAKAEEFLSYTNLDSFEDDVQKRGLTYDFSQFADKVQVMYESAFAQSRELKQDIERIRNLTGIPIKDSENIQEHYASCIKFTNGFWHGMVEDSFKKIAQKEAATGISYRIDENLQQGVDEHLDDLVKIGSSESIQILKEKGLNIDEEKLHKLYNKQFLEKVQENEGIARTKEIGDSFNLTLDETVKSSIVALLPEHEPATIEYFAKAINYDLTSDVLNGFMRKRLNEGKLTETIELAEYFCERPKMTADELVEHANIALEKDSQERKYANSPSKLENYTKVKELSLLANVPFEIATEKVDQLYHRILDGAFQGVSIPEAVTEFGAPLSEEHIERIHEKMYESCSRDQNYSSGGSISLRYKVENVEKEYNMKVPNHILEKLNEDSLHDLSFRNFYTMMRESSEDKSILPNSLDQIFDWLDKPVRNYVQEGLEKRTLDEKNKLLEAQLLEEERAKIPKYVVQSSDSSTIIDISVPEDEEAKFIYGTLHDGRQIIAARPLYECGYHANIVSKLSQTHGSISNLSGGWIVANSDDVVVDRSSQSYGAAPMDKVKSLIEQYQGEKDEI